MLLVILIIACVVEQLFLNPNWCSESDSFSKNECSLLCKIFSRILLKLEIKEIGL